MHQISQFYRIYFKHYRRSLETPNFLVIASSSRSAAISKDRDCFALLAKTNTFPNSASTMLQDYEKVFSGISHPKTPTGLLGRILARIEAERESMAVRRKILWLSAFSISSLPLILSSWIGFQNAASESGLFQLISLAFTDFSVIASHYQDFAMSVGEALPILTISGLLIGGLIFLESSMALARNVKLVYGMKHG